MKPIGVADVFARSSEAAFGKPLVMNVLRGHVVEAMISLMLEPDWKWCSADYAAWDFVRSDGIRLEVKQSALRQSWKPNPDGVARPRFDVRRRAGRWEGATWVAGEGRQADLYVFCYHDRQDDGADHRDPVQWTFYIVSTSQLPESSKTISVASVRRMTPAVGYADLKAAVMRVADFLIKEPSS